MPVSDRPCTTASCMSMGAFADIRGVAMTAGKLIPRAIFTHRWFHKNFEEYPAERKAIIPGIL